MLCHALWGQSIVFESVHGKNQALWYETPYSFHQDQAGFVWIGTQDGLVRYDGTHTKTFSDPQLKNLQVIAIHEDQSNKLWLGQRYEGLTQFDKAHSIFTNFPNTTGHSEFGVYDFFELNNKTWIVSNAGLFSFDPLAIDLLQKDSLKHHKIPVASYPSSFFNDFEKIKESQKVIASIEKPKNQVRTSRSFTLSEDQSILLMALGESMVWIWDKSHLQKNFKEFTDYGWIEDAQGTRIWEMNASNSLDIQDYPSNYNFKACFDILNLKKGSYSLHYTSDQNRSFDSWSDLSPPPFSNAWGIQILSIKEDKAIHWKEQINAQRSFRNEKIPESFLACSYTDTFGNVWLGSYGGGLILMQVEKEQVVFYQIQANKKNKKHLPSNYISSITANQQGQLIVGTMSGGIAVSNWSLNQTKELIKKGEMAFQDFHCIQYPQLKDNWLSRVHVDQDNLLWASMYQGGLQIFKQREASQHFTVLEEEVIHPREINEAKISNIFEDHFGALYLIGSDQNLIKRQHKSIFFRFEQLAKEEKTIIHASIKTPDQQLLIATNQGIYFYNSNNKEWKSIPIFSSFQDVSDFVFDDLNQLWIARTDHGLSCYKYQSSSSSFSLINTFPDLVQHKINALTFSKTEGIVASIFGKGIYFVAQDKWYQSDSKSNSLIHNQVHSLLSTKEGTLWIGSSYGISQYNPIDQNFENFLPQKNIIHLREDRQGNIWVATLRNGLYKKDKKKDSFKSFYLAKETPHIFSIQEDHNGHLWFAGKEGVFHLDKKTQQTTHHPFNQEWGPLTFYCQASEVIENNYLLFGTNKGLLLFNSQNKSKPLAEAKLDLLRIYGTKKEDFNQSLIGQSSVSLSPSQAFAFNIEYQGIHTQNDKAFQYAYYLENYESDWNKDAPSNVARYTSLPPGTYYFHVKAGLNGQWSEAESLKLIIQPAWHQKSWIRLLGFILGLAGILFFIRYREKRIRKKESEKAIIKEQIAKLESKVLRAQMNPHFIFNTLNAIQDKVLDQDFETTMNYISKFSNFLRKTLEISEHSVIPLEREINMLKAYLDLAKIRFDQAFSLDLQIEENLDLEEIEVPAFLIQPLVENALWHGLLPKKTTGRLTIRFFQKEDLLFIEVEDNGIGRTQAANYKSNRLKNRQQEGKGNQLIIHRLEALKQHQSNPKIGLFYEDLFQSNTSTGTLARLVLPLSL